MKKKKQIDGQVVNRVPSKDRDYAPHTLEQLLGDNGMAKYKTLDIAEYEKKLNEMSKGDLHVEAVRVGIVPTDSKSFLISRLLKEFRMYSMAYKKPHFEEQKQKPSAKTLKILSKGK